MRWRELPVVLFLSHTFRLVGAGGRGKQDSLEDFLQLLLPVLLRMLERRDGGLELRNLALAVVLDLTADNRYLFDSASRYG